MDESLPLIRIGQGAGHVGRARERAVSVSRLLVHAVRFGLLGMLLAGLSRLTVVDLDLFHELALARETLAAGHVPTVDVFAFTPTLERVVHHEWGTGLLLYAAVVASGLGATGLMLVKYGLSLFLAVGCVACAKQRGAREDVVAFMAPLVLAMALSGFSTIRAQLFTLCFTLALLLLLSRPGKPGARLVTWLGVYVLWLNMHAGFLVGLGLFGLYTVERIVRAWVSTGSLAAAVRGSAALLACGAVMVVLPIAASPFGTGYYAYLLEALRLPRAIIAEWRPLLSAQSWDVLFCFAVSLAVALYAVWTRGVRSVADVSLLVVTALLAFEHARHLPIYAVVWVCVVPAWLAGTSLGSQVELLWRNRAPLLLVLWVVFGVLGLGYACRNRFWQLRVPTDTAQASEGVPIYPAGAVDYLAEHGFRGNLVVPFDVGAYVSWRLYPSVRVSIDSRYEVAYPPAAAEDAVRLYALEPGWEGVLAGYEGRDAVLVPWWSRLGSGLESPAQRLASGPWRRVYADGAYSLYLTDSAAAPLPVVERPTAAIQASFP